MTVAFVVAVMLAISLGTATMALQKDAAYEEAQDSFGTYALRAYRLPALFSLCDFYRKSKSVFSKQ